MRIAALLLLVTIGAAGCADGTGLPSPPPPGEYVLVRVDDQPLPASVPAEGGTSVEISAGRLTLRTDGNFALEMANGDKTTSYGGFGYGMVGYCTGEYHLTGSFVAFHPEGQSACAPTFAGTGTGGPGLLRVDYRGAILLFRHPSSR